MSRQAKEKRERKCRREGCQVKVYGDARRMRDHEGEHKLVDRAKAAGLYLPKRSSARGSVIV